MNQEERFKDAAKKAGELGWDLCKESNCHEDVIAIASAFLSAAEIMLIQVGGKKFASSVFYNHADQLATD